MKFVYLFFHFFFLIQNNYLFFAHVYEFGVILVTSRELVYSVALSCARFIFLSELSHNIYL